MTDCSIWGSISCPCYLYRGFPVSGKTEELYFFIGMLGTLPTAIYFCLSTNTMEFLYLAAVR